MPFLSLQPLINSFSANGIRRWVMLFVCVDLAWEVFITTRQFIKIYNTVEVPPEISSIMPRENFDKIRKVSLVSVTCELFDQISSGIAAKWVIHDEFLASLWDYAASIDPFGRTEVTTGCIWFFILAAFRAAMELPRTLFIISLDPGNDFDQLNLVVYLISFAIKFTVEEVFDMFLVYMVVKIVSNGGENLFLWLWLMTTMAELGYRVLYPTVVVPTLYNDYATMPDGPLKTGIEKMAKDLDYPLDRVFVVFDSRKNFHGNAQFMGFFGLKTIVLFIKTGNDLYSLEYEETLSILAHEMGHWKSNHTTKLMIFSETYWTLFMFLLASMFKCKPIYEVFGFRESQPVIVGLFAIIGFVLLPYYTLFGFVGTLMTRRCEYEADAFAAKISKTEPLIGAMIKTHIDHSKFPVADKLYSVWYFSHPSLVERIEAIKNRGNN